MSYVLFWVRVSEDDVAGPSTWWKGGKGGRRLPFIPLGHSEAVDNAENTVLIESMTEFNDPWSPCWSETSRSWRKSSCCVNVCTFNGCLSPSSGRFSRNPLQTFLTRAHSLELFCSVQMKNQPSRDSELILQGVYRLQSLFRGENPQSFYQSVSCLKSKDETGWSSCVFLVPSYMFSEGREH